MLETISRLLLKETNKMIGTIYDLWKEMLDKAEEQQKEIINKFNEYGQRDKKSPADKRSS